MEGVCPHLLVVLDGHRRLRQNILRPLGHETRAALAFAFLVICVFVVVPAIIVAAAAASREGCVG